jgi:iron-sulfur cluster assembly protein
MLVVTEQAALAIRDILAEHDLGHGGGLRIAGTAEGDDATLEFSVAEGPEGGDAVVTEGGVSVFLDEVAAAALDDRTLDVEEHGDHVHFSLEEQAAD